MREVTRRSSSGLDWWRGSDYAIALALGLGVIEDRLLGEVLRGGGGLLHFVYPTH